MAKRKRQTGHQLFLLSDGSGNLLEHFVSAIMTQFPARTFQVETVPFLRNEAQLHEAIGRIDGGIICHAFADPKLKAQVGVACAGKGLRHKDVTGPTVEFLEAATSVQASKQVRPLHPLDANYMGRMSALEFAMQHDDNRRIEKLRDADIVLVGISRVSKSPTALFLAYRGFKVSNVSIVPAEGLPAELAKHRKKNVVALTMQPKRLSEIRTRRFSKWELGDTNYESLQDVIHEVRDAEGLYSKRGWPIIDTTDLAIEETSTKILQALDLEPKLFSNRKLEDLAHEDGDQA